MNYFIYILYSPSHDRTYTGQTNNLDKRIIFHNSGKVRSTKPYRPWEIIHSESFSSRAEAMRKEKWFKSNVGRKKIRELLEYYFTKQSG